MIDFIKSITEDELHFISGLDYGGGRERHYVELRKVIFEQNCVANYDQSWYPSEVYELGSNWLQEGYEREFTICTLLVIHNVIQGNDGATDLRYKFDSHAAEYDQLLPHHRDLILEAYAHAGI